MRKIQYPNQLDDLALNQATSERNAYITSPGALDLEDLAYAVHELQRRVGHSATDDELSHEYRLRLLEEGFVAAPPVTEEIPTVPEIENQYQAGKATGIGPGGLYVAVGYPFVNLAYDVEVWGYVGSVNVEVEWTKGYEGITFVAAIAGTTVEWVTRGTLRETTESRVEEGVLYGVTPTGQSVTFAEAFPAVMDANGDYSLIVTGATATGADVEVAISSRTASGFTVTPAVTCTVTWKAVLRTQ